MAIVLAERLKRVKPSPTVALTGRVAKLKAEGKDIVGLGVGDPLAVDEELVAVLSRGQLQPHPPFLC